MTAQHLYEAWRRASKAADAAEEAEAAARVEKIKSRRAADAAEQEHSRLLVEYHRAVDASIVAYAAWQEAHALEDSRGSA